MLDSATQSISTTAFPSEKMESFAVEATELLKSIGHEGRLMLLCHLSNGEKSVTELMELMSISQATTSQYLTRLRAERLVVVQKKGRFRVYSLKDHRAGQMVKFVYHLYCSDNKQKH